MQNKLTILAEAEREAAEMQRYLDRITGLIHAAGRSGDLKTMRLTYEILKDERREMNRHSDLLNAKLNMLKEGNMKRSERMIVGIVILVLMALLLISVVGAQDVPLETNTAVIEGTATLVESTAVPEVAVTEAVEILPTEEVPVVIINNPPSNPQPVSDPSDRLVYVIGFLLFLLYSGVKDYFTTRQTSSLVNTVNKGFDNKLVLDEARERYMQSSMENKEFINLLRAVFGFAGSLNIPVVDPALDKASDWLGSVTAPQPQTPAAEIPNIPDPDPFAQQYPGDGLIP